MWKNIIKYITWFFVTQAFVWTLLSLLTVIVIEGELYIKVENIQTYAEYLGDVIYMQFFIKEGAANTIIPQTKIELVDIIYIPDYTVKGEVFEAFAFIQLILNIAWCITTVLISIWLSKRELDSSKLLTIRIWIIVGCAVAFIDIIFTIILLVDMAEANKAFNHLAENGFINLAVLFAESITAIGVVMTIVCRGFVLWIVNLSILTILFSKLWNLKEGIID